MTLPLQLFWVAVVVGLAALWLSYHARTLGRAAKAGMGRWRS